MPHLDIERRIEALQLRNLIREIGETIYARRQPIGPIEYCVTGVRRGPERAPAKGWKPFPPMGRWGGRDQTTWFRMTAVVPPEMRGGCVVALVRTTQAAFVHGAPDLNEGGEALAYVNGRPLQGLDRNRDELFLTSRARGGERFTIEIEACPSTRHEVFHTFAYADLAVFQPRVWEFYWDCLTALEVYEELDSNTRTARALLDALDGAVRSVDFQHKGYTPYYATVERARRMLRKRLEAFPAQADIGRLVLAGHAHIDTAWLWPIRETQRKCARTFSTVLNLMDRYPEFHFSCSQPVQYDWIKTHYPEIYSRVKRRVKEGRWELCGAPWVEPDHNMPAGESLIRQYLYGNRFFEREFGRRSRIAWVPDSFGYAWSLPQILKKAGITAFVTSKIDWSVFTQFPYSMFEWEGADGTRIFALMPPLNYNGNPTPKDCREQWRLFKQKEYAEELPFPFGWGDGGGGPTMAMIERGRRMKNMAGVPRCAFGRIEDCVERMRRAARGKDLPVYNGELYLELHRACQTTQGRTKRHNRKCEGLLRDAEFLSVLALLEGGKYRQRELEAAWKTVLTNQFHDILPGSSVTEVYEQTEREYETARISTGAVLSEAWSHLETRVNTTGRGTPVLVVNSLSWVRDDVASFRVKPGTGGGVVVDAAGNAVPSQRVGKQELLLDARGVPPLGYAVYRVVPAQRVRAKSNPFRVSARAMENDFVRVRFDKSGTLAGIVDKRAEREVLAPGEHGNVLQLFDDRPHEHDAWDIDHNFERVSWEPGPAREMRVIESGPVRAVVRIVRQTERSKIVQDVTLHAGSPRIDFVTRVKWREKRVLLKAAFPVNVRSPRATYEIQYAAIERPTHRNTAHDRARFENPALRWVDLSEGDYGVSLLNDCKYGYDVRDNVLRISLLRSPINPDPKADEGEHRFTYSLLPHAGDWRCGTVRQAMQLNSPLMAAGTQSSSGPLPPVGAFAAVDQDHVILDWVKKHEDSDAVIVRLYEAYGQRGDVQVTFGRKPLRVAECDLMEENDRKIDLSGHTVRLYVTPFEIRTLKVTFAR